MQGRAAFMIYLVDVGTELVDQAARHSEVA
jgi:hypothetical protein